MIIGPWAEEEFEAPVLSAARSAYARFGRVLRGRHLRRWIFEGEGEERST